MKPSAPELESAAGPSTAEALILLHSLLNFVLGEPLIVQPLFAFVRQNIVRLLYELGRRISIRISHESS